MRFYTESRDGRRRLRLPFAVALFPLVLVTPVVTFYEAGTVGWLGLAVGALAVGFVALLSTWSDQGSAVWIWFTGIDATSRALVIVAVVAGIWTVMWLWPWPIDRIATSSFVVGGLVAVLAIDVVDLWRNPDAKNE